LHAVRKAWLSELKRNPVARFAPGAMFAGCFAPTVAQDSSTHTSADDVNVIRRISSPCRSQHRAQQRPLKDRSLSHGTESTSASTSGLHDEGAHETCVKLSFQLPGQAHTRQDVIFHAVPLCLRFSKTTPLTVTAVGTNFSANCQVLPNWVLTHVDDEPLDFEYKVAAQQIRDATRHLPHRSFWLGGSE